MSTSTTTVETELSLVERISQIEESLKDLKRAARQELKSRRRRRGVKKNADGTVAPKGETPEQLKAWHKEVRSVWDEMRAKDAKTPYKRAVAEASARRKGTPVAPVATAAPVAEKKMKKAKAEAAAVEAPANPVEKKRVAKKTA